MQWLIDLIIEAIGIPPTFIDRGDPLSTDFGIGDFTRDSAWHELDLSAIVPEGAQAVSISLTALATVAANKILLRRAGNINVANIAQMTTFAGNLIHTPDLLVAVDDNRKINYNITAGNWILVFMTVKGWWL